jgi:hypothetical protein
MKQKQWRTGRRALNIVEGYGTYIDLLFLEHLFLGSCCMLANGKRFNRMRSEAKRVGCNHVWGSLS